MLMANKDVLFLSNAAPARMALPRACLQMIGSLSISVGAGAATRSWVCGFVGL